MWADFELDVRFVTRACGRCLPAFAIVQLQLQTAKEKSMPGADSETAIGRELTTTGQNKAGAKGSTTNYSLEPVLLAISSTS